jgi:hypothetical protein
MRVQRVEAPALAKTKGHSDIIGDSSRDQVPGVQGTVPKGQWARCTGVE